MLSRNKIMNKKIMLSLVLPFADQNNTADLNQPTGIAFDPLAVRGNVYVAIFLDDDGGGHHG